MSFQSNGTDIGHQPAGEDLSGSQFCFVKLAPGGWVKAAAGDRATGILQNKPSTGRAALVRVEGVSKLRASAAIAAGATVGPAGTDGRGVTVTGTTPVGATAIEAAAAADIVIAVTLA